MVGNPALKDGQNTDMWTRQTRRLRCVGALREELQKVTEVEARLLRLRPRSRRASDAQCGSTAARADKHTVVSTTHNTGTCTAPAATSTPAPAAPVTASATDALASSATGCFTGWAGSWTAKTDCTCPSTCRTCYHEDGATRTAEECLVIAASGFRSSSPLPNG